MRKHFTLVILLVSLFVGCEKDVPEAFKNSSDLVIFFLSDQHGQLFNFTKIKHIIDQEKKRSNVVLVCSGDMFSGNPVVDNYKDKGYPMIDVMNHVGFDVIALGNHDFDYGESVLRDRIDQSESNIICANLDVGQSGLSPVPAFTNVQVGDYKITFLGLIETNGLEDAVIPSTHPGKVRNLNFERPEHVVDRFANLKEKEGSDLYVALTHLGFSRNGEKLGDAQLANKFPYFDLIIGGHSGESIDTIINNIPVFQVKSHLRNLGKIEISMNNKSIESLKYTSIELKNYEEKDQAIMDLFNYYNDNPYLNEVVGYAQKEQSSDECGCLYTDAIMDRLLVDLALIDKDGIYGNLDEGEIRKKDIFQITRYNYKMMVFKMTAREVKNLLKDSDLGYYYSGLEISLNDENVIIKNKNGEYIDELSILTVGINDYIPAIHKEFFPQNGTLPGITDAQAIISYLENSNANINYESCNRYFQFQ